MRKAHLNKNIKYVHTEHEIHHYHNLSSYLTQIITNLLCKINIVLRFTLILENPLVCYSS